MAGNATIGSLRVSLGLDSAQFTNGLKKAETGLGTFGRTAAAGLALVASAAAAATVALGYAVKGAIDHADALSKSAQKAGVTTEALSRLAYAASYSDVTLESLTGSLGKLSKTMADATQNTKGGAASAFAALGISVTDANGKLRDSDQVFSDVADRFARLEDGATKTAISMALFGKSGAELIPLLNGGSSELQRFSAEADRLGITLSTKTGRDAERFNDTLSMVGQILQGVYNKIAEKALPALQQLAETLASPQFAKGAAAIAEAIVTSMDAIAGKVGVVVELFQNFGSELLSVGGLLKNIPVLGLNTGIGIGGLQIGPGQKGANSSGSPDDRGGGKFGGTPITIRGGSTGTPDMNLGLFTGGGFGKTVKTELDPFAARVGELSDVLTKTHDPFKQMQEDLTDLGTMFKEHRISAEQFGSAITRTTLNATGDFAGMAAGITGALGNLFKSNKAFAVSTAILQGLQGVAYALGSSAPPFNFINAAAVGIEAAANVASILSTNENSTSMPGGAGGSGGQAAAAASQSSAINLTIKGSGSISIDDFATQLSKSIADGGNQQLVKVIRAA